MIAPRRTPTLLPVLFATLCAAALLAGAARSAALCTGDCDGNDSVTIAELIASVRFALDADRSCPAADRNGNGSVAVDEVIAAVRAALTGCPLPPPNIIVIELDDIRADGLDRMPVVQSRLVGEGVSFANSFVPLSLCCPSRASLLSGRYAIRHGARHIDGEFGGASAFRKSGADTETIAVWLQNAGYLTGLFGKYLNTYNAEQDQGPSGGFYIPPGWSRWRALVEDHYGGQLGPTYELVDESGARTIYDDHTTDEQYSTDVLGRLLREFVADAAGSGQPFFAVWTPLASHFDTPKVLPIPAARHFDLFADLPPARPPNFLEADRSDKPAWVRDIEYGRLAVGANHAARRRAYEALLSVDEQLGLLLEQLVGYGVADDTVILLTSDNGVAYGEHALLWQTKECPYEECLRVPLIVRDGRAAAAPRTVDTPVLNIDVAATVAEIAGVPIPVDIDGSSFRAALDGAAEWQRDDFLLEHWGRIRDALLSVPAVPPRDGDRVRLLYGAWPKHSLAFEFDADGSVSAGAVAIAITPTGQGTFAALGAAVAARVPDTAAHVDGAWLIIEDTSALQTGLIWFEEVDRGSLFFPFRQSPDFFGVRDVANGFTYVELGTGELELYDLSNDPWQLDNRAGSPEYAATQQRLRARLYELLSSP